MVSRVGNFTTKASLMSYKSHTVCVSRLLFSFICDNLVSVLSAAFLSSLRLGQQSFMGCVHRVSGQSRLGVAQQVGIGRPTRGALAVRLVGVYLKCW